MTSYCGEVVRVKKSAENILTQEGPTIAALAVIAVAITSFFVSYFLGESADRSLLVALSVLIFEVVAAVLLCKCQDECWETQYICLDSEDWPHHHQSRKS